MAWQCSRRSPIHIGALIVRAAALDVGPLCVNHLVVVLELSVLRRVTAARARFCSGKLLYVEDSRDNQRIDYIHLGGKLVAQRSRPIYTNTATVTYHHADHIGSANFETDAYGDQTQRTTRMPYGSPYDGLYREGAGYAGHVTDTQTNLTYMQQRYYDPVALRFLSPDPVDVSASDGGNFNRYWYGHNNPYRFVDPDGRLSQFAKANSDWLTQIDDPNVGEDQAMFGEALDRELSRLFGTPMGETMKEAAIAISGLILRTNNEFMNEAALNSGKKNIDPLFKATADTTDGRQQSSLAAIIAHELGHARFGVADDGPSNMNNVSDYENPVRIQINEPKRATYYKVD